MKTVVNVRVSKDKNRVAKSAKTQTILQSLNLSQKHFCTDNGQMITKKCHNFEIDTRQVNNLEIISFVVEFGFYSNKSCQDEHILIDYKNILSCFIHSFPQ